MDDNPRIAELRKKLDKDPGSRLFAQLAEELRKEGRFEEAISECRRGLEKNPNYPSARLTLARALLDSGRPGDARPELEQIVKASPDNIMASRLLGDACEDLGEIPRAIQQFEHTLRLSPGDKVIIEKLDELKRKLAAPAPSPVVSAPLPPFEAPAELPSVEAAPEVEAPEVPQTLPVVSIPQAAAASAPMALDRDLSSGTLSPGALSVSEIMHFDAANAPHTEAAVLPEELPSAEASEAANAADAGIPAVETSPSPLPSAFAADDEPIVEQTIAFGQAQQHAEDEAQTIAFAKAAEVAQGRDEPEPEPAPPAQTAPTDDDDVGAQTLPLTSMTLADLYLQQGLKAEASAVLSQVLKEEPENKQAAARLAEVSDEKATALAPPAEHFEDASPVPVVSSWPTAPLPSLPASALPAAMLAQAASTELGQDAAATAPSAPRTKAQINQESIRSLKTFLGAVEREAVEQRATEQRTF